uniref:Uncharacterized protein n=1 Tax=Neobodo designis TaxID=312471 RepID=A0A7S1MI19_NEODS
MCSPHLPPLADDVVPPESLPSLRRVVMKDCGRMLHGEGTWRFLWRLPELSDLAVDCDTNVEPFAVAALRACASDGAAIATVRLSSLELGKCYRRAPGSAARAGDGPTATQVLAATSGLRVLCLRDCRAFDVSALAAIGRAELLHELAFGDTVRPHDPSLPQILSRFQNLRTLAFALNSSVLEVRDHRAVLQSLTSACPALRSVAFDTSTAELWANVRATDCSGRSAEVRWRFCGGTWIRSGVDLGAKSTAIAGPSID